MGQGAVIPVGANLAAVVPVGVLFDGLWELVRETPGRFGAPFMWLVEVWLGVLLAAGLVVCASDLAALVIRRSRL